MSVPCELPAARPTRVDSARSFPQATSDTARSDRPPVPLMGFVTDVETRDARGAPGSAPEADEPQCDTTGTEDPAQALFVTTRRRRRRAAMRGHTLLQRAAMQPQQRNSSRPKHEPVQATRTAEARAIATRAATASPMLSPREGAAPAASDTAPPAPALRGDADAVLRTVVAVSDGEVEQLDDKASVATTDAFGEGRMLPEPDTDCETGVGDRGPTDDGD